MEAAGPSSFSPTGMSFSFGALSLTEEESDPGPQGASVWLRRDCYGLNWRGPLRAHMCPTRWCSKVGSMEVTGSGGL